MQTQSIKEKREMKRINEILDAAQEVFTEKGFHGATVNDIADRALISKFTLYKHFDSKDAILNAILSRGYEILTASVTKRIKDIEDPRQRIMGIIRAEFEFFENRKSFFQMLLLEKLDFESEVKNNILSSYRKHILFIEKEIHKGIREGSFRSVNAEDAAFMLFATLRAFALRWLFKGTKRSLSSQADSVYDLIIRCLESDRK